MGFVSLDINGTERTCRTQIFTRTAPDTPFGIHHRYQGREIIVGDGGYHRDCSRRTMSGAITALHAVCQDNAILLYPYGMADLYSGLFFSRNLSDCSSRANLRTFRTFGTTITAFIRKFRLHKRFQPGGRAQYPVRADRHA